MSETPQPGRRLAAVWFADIVGYTALSARDEDAALRVVSAFQRIADEIVGQHSGRVVKYIGDAALAEFASTDGAIRSALALMERFADDEAARTHGSTLRVGVNVGEVISSPDGDIYGDGVNLASRLQNQAAPGQVIASEAVHAQIRQRPVFRTEPLGQRAVKGVAGPVNLYAVTLQEAGSGPPAAPPRGAPAGAGARAPRRWLVPSLLGLAAMGVGALVVIGRGGSILPAGGIAVTRVSFPMVEGGMGVGSALTVTFSGAIDPATATSANVRLLDVSGDPVPAQVAVGEGERAIEVRPLYPLRYGDAYTLVLEDALLDARGRPVRAAAGTRDEARYPIRTQPVPAGTPPGTAEMGGEVTPQSPVLVRFGQDMDRRSVDAERIRLTDEQGSGVQAGVSLAEDRRTARLTPVKPLAAGARYTVRIDSTVMTATGLRVEPRSLPFRVAAAAPARAEPALPPPPAQTAERPAAQPATQAAAATPEARTGPGSGPATLNLRASPAAALPFLKVVVNGDTLGPPPVSGVKLADGRSHTIAVVGIPELSSYSLVVFRREVAPQPGQVLDINAEITAFGSIDVVSQPVGTVFVDGRQVGRTPLAGFPVTAGVVHRLEIRPTAADADRFAPYTGEFRVGPLEWKSLGRISLPPRE